MGPTRLCVMCEGVLTSKLELTKESFQPTLTLERTLEMLSKGTSIPKFDTKILFNVLTSLEGSSVCCSCSAILNSGLQVTAQILLLESRLKNLGARIRKSAAITRSFESHQQIRKSPRNNSHPDFSFSKLFSESTKVAAPESRKESKHGGTVSSTKKTSIAPNSKRITESEKNPSVNKSTGSSPSSHKRSPAAPESPPSLPAKQRRHHSSGVQDCPSCDFTLDVRSPSQAKSSKSLPLSVREGLRKKSHRLLVQHFMDAHLPTSAKENFERRKSDGVKTYFCPGSDCPYKSHLLRDLTRHFMGHHVCPPSAEPSLLSCPEKDCSCTIPVTRKSGRQDKYTLNYAKDQLAAHVYRDHDIPSHPSLRNALVKNSKFALLADVIKDNEHRKAYRCSRCDYEDLLPKKIPRPQCLISRHAFLQHFYDAHVKES